LVGHQVITVVLVVQLSLWVLIVQLLTIAILAAVEAVAVAAQIRALAEEQAAVLADSPTLQRAVRAALLAVLVQTELIGVQRASFLVPEGAAVGLFRAQEERLDQVPVLTLAEKVELEAVAAAGMLEAGRLVQEAAEEVLAMLAVLFPVAEAEVGEQVAVVAAVYLQAQVAQVARLSH
jgi:hypothetical protein